MTKASHMIHARLGEVGGDAGPPALVNLKRTWEKRTCLLGIAAYQKQLVADAAVCGRSTAFASLPPPLPHPPLS